MIHVRNAYNSFIVSIRKSKDGRLNESDFRQCYGRFFESAIRKVTSFSTIMSHIESSILKDTLQLKILRRWIKIRSDSFIKTWVNMMKRKPTKVHKKSSLHFKEHCIKICRWHFTYFYTLPFLSNKLLDSKQFLLA